MQKITLIFLMLFYCCFVFASEKELPQDEIQKMYMDYFSSEFDKIKGISPIEKAELCAHVDSAIKKYQLIPNRGNNTLRKFEFFKVFEQTLHVIESKSSFDKFSDSKKIAYIAMEKPMIEYALSLVFASPVIGIENEKKLRQSLEKLEKNLFSYLVREEKKKKNLSPSFQIGKETLASGTKSVMTTLVFVSDDDFKKYKIIEKINSINTKDFEKKELYLGLPCTCDLIEQTLAKEFCQIYKAQLEDSLQLEHGTRKQQLIYIEKLRHDYFKQPMKDGTIP